MRFKDRENGRFPVFGDKFRKVLVWKLLANDVSVGIARQWRTIQNGIDRRADFVASAPPGGYDMVVIEIAIGWNIAVIQSRAPARTNRLKIAL